MHGSYSYPLVALSIVVAVLASHAALQLIRQVALAPSRATSLGWLVGGAVAMGLGVWAMHFIGMLAYESPASVTYAPGLTALSVLIAMLASGLALWVNTLPRLTPMLLMTSGTIMGGGIATMHYTGMAAMHMNMPYRYDPLLFAVSIVVAVVAATASEAEAWGELAREAGPGGGEGPGGSACVALEGAVPELWTWAPGDGGAPRPPSPGAGGGGSAPPRVSHVYFTSGSTGAPKPCVCTLDNLAAYCFAKNARQGVGPGSVVLLASPLTFDPFLGDAVATLAAAGAALVVPPRSRVFSALGACLRTSGATHVQTTPALWGTLAAAGVGPAELPALRVVALGGEAIPPAMAAEWGGGSPSAATAAGGVRLLNVYGVTECCVYQACRAVSGPADRRLLGPPLGGTSLLLRAPLAPASDPGEEPREVLPGSGELAELWLAGPQVGLGYLAPHPPRAGAGAGGGEEEARFRHLGAHGWCFRTGDVVVCSASGLELRGRKDSQVKVRGQRVELGEIEEVLLGGAPELVRQAAAVLHAPDGGLLALWCVAPAGEEESARGGGDDATAALRSRVLREVARAGLPGHMVPARFVFVPELPITASGKVSRRELLRQGLPPVLPPASGAGGGSGGGGRLQDGWEELVAEVWAQELGLPEAPLELGRGANFGELGGHSLLALQVCKSLAQRVREGEGGSASSVSGIVTDAETGGEFGELLGALAPVELLARQDLGEYASHLRGAFGPRPAAVLGGGGGGGEEAEEGAVKVERGGASLLASAASAGCLGAVRVLLRLLSSSALTPPPLPAAAAGSMGPLHCACAHGHTGCAAALLDAGAGVNQPGPDRAPPLLFAAQRGPVPLLQLLAGHGARLADARDDSGLTALHHACRAGAPLKVVSALHELLSSPEGAGESAGGAQRKNKKKAGGGAAAALESHSTVYIIIYLSSSPSLDRAGARGPAGGRAGAAAGALWIFSLS